MSNISLSRPLASGLALILCLGLVGGCASRSESPSPRDDDARAEQCGVCGKVRFVQQVVQQSGPSAPSADGGLLGGATGGVVRAPGVGVANSRQVLDRLTIDMDFGGSQIVEIPGPSGIRRGDRVEVRGNFVTVIRDEF